jgi:hypothetical protein
MQRQQIQRLDVWLTLMPRGWGGVEKPPKTGQGEVKSRLNN